MIKGVLDGEIVFYWQTDKNVPQRYDRVFYEGILYEVLFRLYMGTDIHLALKIVQ